MPLVTMDNFTGCTSVMVEGYLMEVSSIATVIV